MAKNIILAEKSDFGYLFIKNLPNETARIFCPEVEIKEYQSINSKNFNVK